VLEVLIGLSFHSEGLEFLFFFLGTTRHIKNLDRKLLAFFIDGELDFSKSSFAYCVENPVVVDMSRHQLLKL
jgi:hypothetical protein